MSGEGVGKKVHLACNANLMHVTPREHSIEDEFSKRLSEESSRDINPEDIEVYAEVMRLEVQDEDELYEVDAIRVTNGSFSDSAALAYEVLGMDDGQGGLREADDCISALLEERLGPRYGVRMADNPDEYV
ncbi:MAG: hypothetical protein ABEJ07_00420 [Candidatus Nanohaloarchaea archaeon]